MPANAIYGRRGHGRGGYQNHQNPSAAASNHTQQHQTKAAASNHTQRHQTKAAVSNPALQQARRQGTINPQSGRGDRVQRPPRTTPRNRNGGASNVFIPKPGQGNRRSQYRVYTDRDGDVVMQHVQQQLRRDTGADPDSDVEMVDAPPLGTTPSTSMAQALQALARSFSSDSDKVRQARNQNRRDADGDITMPDAPPLMC